MLFEIQRINSGQPFLEKMYKALLVLAYYGFFRISELVGIHAMKACNVHMAINKEKLLVILYSSKTHHEGCHPQKIKITSNRMEHTGNYVHRYFCPLRVTNEYIACRGEYVSSNKNFFIFSDRSNVSSKNAREVLKSCLSCIGINPTLYGMHSFRIGQTSDLIRFSYSMEEIRRMGRWKSNAIFKYIR